MPYNVIDRSLPRTERVYCETAAKALSQHRVWSETGRTDIRVVSVEGTEVSVERLTVLAGFEPADPGRRRPAA